MKYSKLQFDLKSLNARNPKKFKKMVVIKITKGDDMKY